MKPRHMLPSTLTAVVVTLAGCANIYEGVKARDEAARPPAERAVTPPPMSHEQYEAERRRLGRQ